MRTLARLLLLALAVLLGASAHAAPAPTLRFEHLSVDDGLVQESVLAIVQDADGFMWFGTQTGLSRFDGYRMTNYRNVVGDPRTLAHNYVRALFVDRKGQLWVGTDGGLDRFDPATQGFTHFAPSEPGRQGNANRRIMKILDDGKGGMWLGTGDGLQHFDPATGKFHTWHRVPGDASSLSDDLVNALALDAGGRLWVGTAAGLDSMAPGAASFEHYRSPFGRAYETIHALLLDRDHGLWVGSAGGLVRWAQAPRGERHLFGPAEGLKPGEIDSLYRDEDGMLWIGSREHGLYRWRWRSSSFAHYPHLVTDRHSLADDRVPALYRDRVGTLWVGTWYGGVSRVDLGSGGFARILREPDARVTPGDNKVRALAAGPDGKLWMATNDGINLYDPSSGVTTQVYRHQPNNRNSLIDQAGNALAVEKNGVLWIGANTGVTRFDPATGRFTRHVLVPGNTNANTVRFMRTDREGILWISTTGGLHRLDPASGKLTTYRRDPSDPATLSDNTVRPVLEDSRGRFWVGSFGGLSLLDRATGKFRHFRHDDADPSTLSHDEVHYLLEDRKGNLWVGTAVGLNRMVEGKDGKISFVRYTSNEGLANDDVAAMLEDQDGRIWASTSIGLSCLDPATGAWRNYGAADGTTDGAYFDGSALAMPDGTLYFGGFNGMTAFNPREIHDNSIAPRAVITGFQIFNQPIAQVHPGLLSGPIEQAKRITLSAGESIFSLEFSALHFAAPQRNRFAYRLENFDQDWVSTDAGKRFATYTNLDPGYYVFRVRAANKDGVWSDTPASLEIIIEPPYWKTWWFRVLGVILLAGVTYGIILARLSGLRRQKELLERQVSARTEEIELQNRLLERQTQELREQEQQVRQNTHELAQANRALHENEERLRLAKQRAEDATRQKSEFLANMSHEMRTPLAGVIGMLGFALRDAQLKDATREQIVRGQANAQSLLSIINDLLDFSKIEAGKLTIENIDFALDATIENVVSLFEEQAAVCGVDFAIELAPGLPRFVVGDPTRLRQVLVNLVGNAFKFTNEGMVRLCVERRLEDQVADAQGRNMIRFSVQDTGIGIAAEALPRIFQKFEQADSTTTRRYGGTGLGLAICRQLVQLMGGWISVESTEGEGSTFTFVLPLADGVRPPQEPRAPRAPHTHKLKVLCAEDFPTNQIIIRTMLEELGHEVDIAENGRQALDACTRKRYDLILMDGRMPEMDGITAARLIRAGGEPGSPVLDPQVMIVALTANASEEDRSRYLASGMDGFLSKPIDEDSLHAKLTRAIGVQLARGIALEPLSPAAAKPPSTAELDAMFGVFTGPAPLAEAAGHGPKGGGDLRERVRAAFAADLPRRRGELNDALARRDGEACALLLHGLRGSAAYLGEIALNQLCAELEAAADNGDWTALDAALPQLAEMLDAFAGACT
ncbi:ATP-binding protein [Massilia agilis]|uniref:histidine kinase n=1 Tax=Massilia agilis TaxID=1811226 RepID=A0ABT2DBC1_9BURK|nr:hybrid sensor histidine kinase/response regulator [Massilia agilis]MCS0808571.1 ATP-binding protein [Massilia agilis]